MLTLIQIVWWLWGHLWEKKISGFLNIVFKIKHFLLGVTFLDLLLANCKAIHSKGEQIGNFSVQKYWSTRILNSASFSKDKISAFVETGGKFLCLFWISAKMELFKENLKEPKIFSTGRYIELTHVCEYILKLPLLYGGAGGKKLLWYCQSTKILNNRGNYISWNVCWNRIWNYIWEIYKSNKRNAAPVQDFQSHNSQIITGAFGDSELTVIFNLKCYYI